MFPIPQVGVGQNPRKQRLSYAGAVKRDVNNLKPS